MRQHDIFAKLRFVTVDISDDGSFNLIQVSQHNELRDMLSMDAPVRIPTGAWHKEPQVDRFRPEYWPVCNYRA